MAPPHRQADDQDSCWPGTASVCPDTLVHFHKSFGVMQELFDHRDFASLAMEVVHCAALATPAGVVAQPRFLDLGCAPGGFSACLLQDHVLGPCSVGFGTSLPTELGGFDMAYSNPGRLMVQLNDLLSLNSIDLMAPDNSIDLVVADAQYLSSMVKQKHLQTGYRGLHVRSKTLGIWALTVKECQLAFTKLRHTGSFMFRFSWRGDSSASTDVHPNGEKVSPSLLAKYQEEEEWYKALTHWLFSVLKSLFGKLTPFKSEYVHQADVSFYMVCRGFDRHKYLANQWEAKLHRAFDELTCCGDEASLVASIKHGISESARAEIDSLLELVGRMRAIGIQSRKVTNPAYLGVPAAKAREAKGLEAVAAAPSEASTSSSTIEDSEPTDEAAASDGAPSRRAEEGPELPESDGHTPVEDEEEPALGTYAFSEVRPQVPCAWPHVQQDDRQSPPPPLVPETVEEARSPDVLGVQRQVRKALHVQAFHHQLQQQQQQQQQHQQLVQLGEQQLCGDFLWMSQPEQPQPWPAYFGDHHPAVSWPWSDPYAGVMAHAPAMASEPAHALSQSPTLAARAAAQPPACGPLLLHEGREGSGNVATVEAASAAEATPPAPTPADGIPVSCEEDDAARGSGRGRIRHRGGQAVRERRNGRRAVHGASVLTSLRGNVAATKARKSAQAHAQDSLVHLFRFALFCVTSWSMRTAILAASQFVKG